MVDKILEEPSGPITYSVWKDPEPTDQVADMGEEEEVVQEEQEERLNQRYVKNVIREPTMYYFDVPKMGCYLAIPLTFRSCLYEGSFDAGVADLLDVIQRKADQETSKLQSDTRSRKESVVDENPEAEEELFEEINEAPYQTREVKLVVCLDTLR